MPAKPVHCHECRALIPLGTPAGLCVACLLRLAESESLEPAPVEASAVPTRRLGDFEILRELGRGGMGVVYEARQHRPTRTVALKMVLHGEWASELDVARFREEAEVVASLDHPHIVPIFGVGEHDGRHFYSMKLCAGGNLDQNRSRFLSDPKATARLLSQIARAVHCAHQHGILHRDLKPANLLFDTEGQPYVADFGLARFQDRERRLTRSSILPGTPEYLAPERISDQRQLTVASDIWSLGVILYELIAGRRPFTADSIPQLLRQIAEVEPASPSSVRGQRWKEPPISSAARDLDTLCLKCLAKDPARRYANAAALSEDLEHWLNGEPISARPPSDVERLRLFARRHKVGFITVSALVLSILGGLAVSTTLYFREKTALQQAQTEAAKSLQVAQFLEQMLGSVGPSVALGRDTALLQDLADRTSQRLGNELSGQPEVEAQLRSTLGRVYEELGDYDKAEFEARRALNLNRIGFGPRSLEVADSLSGVARALMGRGKLADAEALNREALAIREKRAGTQSLLVVDSLNDLSEVQLRQARFPDAEESARRAFAICDRHEALKSKTAVRTLHNLASSLHEQIRYDEAEPLYLEALAASQWLFPGNHPETARLLQNLGQLRVDQRNLAEGESALRQSVAMQRSLLDAAHPDFAISASLLVDALLKQHKLAEADAFFSECLTPAFVEDPGSGPLLRARGRANARTGRWKEAANDFARVVKYSPSDHFAYLQLAPLLVYLGDWEGYRHLCDQMVGQFGDTKDFLVAERMAKSCLLSPHWEFNRTVVNRWTDLALAEGEGHPYEPHFQFAKGLFEYRLGRYAEASERLQKALTTVGNQDGNRDAQARTVLAMTCHRLKRPDQARDLLSSASALADQHLPKLENGDLLSSWHNWLTFQILKQEATALMQQESDR